MATTTDIELFIAPISEDSPSGESLRYDPVYDQIQEARREDDPNLPQGSWETSLKKADWREVERLATGALTKRTKDLQIAAWLLEAWMNLKGYEGLCDGLELVNALSKGFWESIYPALDPEDPEFRLAPLEWIPRKLPLVLKQIPITEASTSSSAYTLLDVETAQLLENAARKDPTLLEAAERQERVTMQRFTAGATATRESFYTETIAHIDRALAMVTDLSAFLDEQYGTDAPSFRPFTETLQGARTQCRDILRARGVGSEGVEGETDEASITEEASTAADGTPTGGSSSGPLGIRNRNDAYRMLQTIADYLLQVEPHSPAPYLVQRAVTWGNMPLATLLQELMDGNHDVASIYKLLGIRDSMQ